ncbi:amidohydrolase 3 [Lophium mytilinum]|uniref:Amidohydrolase 3 n=1 Tax=Lophium mytilinum TaxID=390894 RepID=A0A6A6QPE1_9PEZI|nr:amidohydrolase 3 [Lophium mytilinum]
MTYNPEGILTAVFDDLTSYPIYKAGTRHGYAYPGLWDGHGHLLQYGEMLESVNLFGSESMDDVLGKISLYLDKNPQVGTSTEWLRGIGWDQAAFGGKMPTSLELEDDDSIKGKYIMLDRVDVHCIWVSQAVLNLLPDPLPETPGGEVITAPGPGVFCDNAMDLVLKYFPRPSKSQKTRFIKNAMKDLHSLGIVGIHDAGVPPADIQLYEELVEDKDWSLRVYAMLECEKRNTVCFDDAFKVTRDDGLLDVRSVKLFADGALGSWGSAMITPYTDHTNSSGSLLVNASTLTNLTTAWASAGYQVNIHAIGDLANRLAIDAMTAAFDALCPDTPHHDCQALHRFRIEHAQIIHPDDQKRMLEMGIIPSIQPTHATSDMAYAETRLGPQRTKEEAYRMRSLLPLNPVLGSDFPVEPANIFQGLFAAVTRRSPHTGLGADGDEKGWYADETLTLEEALKGFTLGPAHAAFLEGKAGAIEVGGFADWIVLDEPLEEMDIDELRSVKVRETWVAGKLVYRRFDKSLGY